MKKYKPNSPGLRRRQIVDYSNLKKATSNKRLTKSLKTKSGRNNTGQLTVRHRGGGSKRKYRVINFRSNLDKVIGKVISIEYDPYRTAYIALISFSNGQKQYRLSSSKMKIGSQIIDGDKSLIKDGNVLKLRDIPVGCLIYNIELLNGKGGQLCRSAGTYATLMSKLENKAQIKLPSGVMKYIDLNSQATIGEVSNSSHRNRVVGKAGANRWKRKRPTVRGVVMNPADHPHGGGEGKAPIGLKRPVSFSNVPALGYKTKSRKKSKDKGLGV